MPEETIKIELRKKLSKQSQNELVQMIVDGISCYNNSPLLKYAKAKSVGNTSSRFIMAMREQEIIGFLMYRMEKKECFLYEIHIKKEHRGKGYGEILLEKLKELQIKERDGQAKIVLFVHRNNHRAQKLYRRVGFSLGSACMSSYYSMVWDTSTSEINHTKSC